MALAYKLCCTAKILRNVSCGDQLNQHSVNSFDKGLKGTDDSSYEKHSILKRKANNFSHLYKNKCY